jgi:hypothetical protein
MKKNEKKGKFMYLEGEPQVFEIDEQAISRQRDRFELTRLSTELKDPGSTLHRVLQEKPEKKSEEVLKTMGKRKTELIKKITDDFKFRLSGKKPITLFRPLPARSGEFDLAMPSIEDYLRGTDISFAPKPWNNRPCETQKGTIYEPSWFTVNKYKGDSGNPSIGGMTYQLDDGVSNFLGLLVEQDLNWDHYTILGELGYKFPCPNCDSRLTWDFKLGAGASFFYTDLGILWLDYRVYEQADASQQPPGIPLMLGGDLLEINECDDWNGIAPITVSGAFNVTSGTESRLWVALCVTIWAAGGVAGTEGLFQLYAGEWGGFSPGVNYRLDPI